MMLRKGQFAVDSDKVLGTGAFGVVHPARDLVRRRGVAAKRIDSHDTEKLHSVAADMKRLVSLDHINVVKVFEVLLEPTPSAAHLPGCLWSCVSMEIW